MVQSTTLSVKHLAGTLAECMLFGTPEQYKEQAANLRKQFGKGILRSIVRNADIVASSYEANMARAKGLSYQHILRRKNYRNYLSTLGSTTKMMEDNSYDEDC